MHAAAILAPGISAEQVARFELSGVELRVASAVPAGANAVLVFGGDGSVHRQLAAVVAAEVPLLVVPAGSGNDFAHSLGLNSPQHALAAWERFCRRRDNARRIDLGVITPCSGERETGNVLFCCIGGAGLDAETNRRANAMPAWLRAHGGYALAAMGAIAGWRPAEMRVQFDGRELRGPATLVAFANAPAYGGGMRMAPDARLDDGKLDLCFVRRAGRLRLLTFFPTVFCGAHLRLPEVEYTQTDALRLATDPPLDVYADGEFICRTPVAVTIRRSVLQVVAPL